MTELYHAPERTLQPSPKRRPDTRTRTVVLRTITNLPVRVPGSDWEAVTIGQKRMFRAYARGARRLDRVVPEDTPCPRPVLLFARRGRGTAKRILQAAGVLLGHRQEPLGAISPEDLAAEGFEFLPAFRRYWRLRYPRLGWRPFDMVSVLQVRPLREDDEEWAADWLLESLFSAVLS